MLTSFKFSVTYLKRLYMSYHVHLYLNNIPVQQNSGTPIIQTKQDYCLRCNTCEKTKIIKIKNSSSEITNICWRATDTAQPI